MNTNKIAFITCVNNEALYMKSLEYIKKLQLPEFMEIELIAIRDAKSMTSAYNEAMQKSDSKYKVYLHQDVYIQNENFIIDILDIFKNDENIGLMGMVGAKIIPVSGIWWEDHIKVGKVFDSHRGFIELLNFNEVQDSYTDVKGIDGLIMITQYDLPWRDDIFDGWHFYDLSQSVEFIKKGFKVIVPSQKIAWCLHDCGIVNTKNGFEQYRNKFLDTYSKDLFPLVSILIPAYNQTNYLEEALNSALNQSYRNTEIIICDDSTTNDVKELIKEYMIKNSKIKYFNNGGPSGLRGQMNIRKCLEASSGEYINYLLHDDVFNLDKIDKMINYFLYDNTLSLVTSYRKMINKNGDYLNDNFRTICQYPSDTRLTGEEAGRKLLFSMINYIGELTTAMFKREALDSDIVDYDKYKIYCLSDISLWLKLFKKGNIIYISEPLSKFRIHEFQNTYDDTFTLWASIDFFNMILSSYENNIFIKNRRELLESLKAWYKEYSHDLIRFSEQYNNHIENNSEMILLKNEYINCYSKFINILLE
ncbi:glycosyltransferase [Clostridium beijerinckii]|uniref:glycosyltransferase n=1 Tax=Clostridium beijerinckii TaxID=1520 RepID=UPI0009C9E15A|nr:glycosyltransferase [Clostridium beijerinckii]NRT75732.1 glycosyltransferase involved in cell wall biosynthesis [Clostridium beijerinckii]OOM41826.1 hyaluronan synthase [Clostridium beijerinckii]